MLVFTSQPPADGAYDGHGCFFPGCQTGAKDFAVDLKISRVGVNGVMHLYVCPLCRPAHRAVSTDSDPFGDDPSNAAFGLGGSLFSKVKFAFDVELYTVRELLNVLL